MFNAPKQNCMRNLERFRQSSILSEKPGALFPPKPSNCTSNSWYIIETSSGLPRKSLTIFGNVRTSSGVFVNSRKTFGNVRLAFRTILRNLRKVVGNLRKIIKNTVISMFIERKEHYTLARRYELYVLVARTISHEWAQRTSEILERLSLTLRGLTSNGKRQRWPLSLCSFLLILH